MLTAYLPHNVRPVAWTGGDSERPVAQCSLFEIRLALSLYAEQVQTFSAYWGDAPTDDTCGIFWNRARGDAHATMRDAARRQGAS